MAGCWREAQGRGSSSQDAMYTSCFPRRTGIDFNSPGSPEVSSYCFGASQQNGSSTSWHTAQAALEGRRLSPARHSAPATWLVSSGSTLQLLLAMAPSGRWRPPESIKWMTSELSQDNISVNSAPVTLFPREYVSQSCAGVVSFLCSISVLEEVVALYRSVMPGQF